jgi:hypothetical protein
MEMQIIRSRDIERGKLFEVNVNNKVIRIILTWHAMDGAEDYNRSANELINFIVHPEEVIRGHENRFVAHKRLDHHLARVVYEYENETIVVITFYISHAERYFRGGVYEDKILS